MVISDPYVRNVRRSRTAREQCRLRPNEANGADSDADIEDFLGDAKLPLVVCFHIESSPSAFLDMYIGFAADLADDADD